MDTPGIDSFGLDDLKNGDLIKYSSEWEEINQRYFFVSLKTTGMIMKLIVESVESEDS